MEKIIINEKQLPLLTEKLKNHLSTINWEEISNSKCGKILSKHVLKGDEEKLEKVMRYLKYLRHTKGSFDLNDVVNCIIRYCVMAINDGGSVKMKHYPKNREIDAVLHTTWKD